MDSRQPSTVAGATPFFEAGSAPLGCRSAATASAFRRVYEVLARGRQDTAEGARIVREHVTDGVVWCFFEQGRFHLQSGESKVAATYFRAAEDLGALFGYSILVIKARLGLAHVTAVAGNRTAAVDTTKALLEASRLDVETCRVVALSLAQLLSEQTTELPDVEVIRALDQAVANGSDSTLLHRSVYEFAHRLYWINQDEAGALLCQRRLATLVVPEVLEQLGASGWPLNQAMRVSTRLAYLGSWELATQTREHWTRRQRMETKVKVLVPSGLLDEGGDAISAEENGLRFVIDPKARVPTESNSGDDLNLPGIETVLLILAQVLGNPISQGVIAAVIAEGLFKLGKLARGKPRLEAGQVMLLFPHGERVKISITDLLIDGEVERAKVRSKIEHAVAESLLGE